MLTWGIIVVLFVLWMGFRVAFPAGGGAIANVPLVAALVLLAFKIFAGRRSRV